MKIYEKETHEAKLLVLEYETGLSELDEKLIDSIESRSLLKPHSRDPEGLVTRYDISQYETLQEYLINRKLSRTEMIGFLAQLKSVIGVLEDHMLGDSNILLDPPHILIDSMNRKVRFVPARVQEGTFTQRIRPLVEAMFLHADISHPEALYFAAELMKVQLRGNVHLHDLMQLIDPMRGEAVKAEARQDTVMSVTGPAGSFNAADDQVTVLLNPEETAGRELPASGQTAAAAVEEEEKAGIRGFFSGLGNKVKDLMERDE